jgi:hypothetical protein
MRFVGTTIFPHSTTEKSKSRLRCIEIEYPHGYPCRFEGQRQSLDNYGRHQGQDSQVKTEFKSLSVNPATKAAAKPADDDDDVDLFGDEDEEESEQTKQRLAEYAKKKANSNRQRIELSLLNHVFCCRAYHYCQE